MSEWSMTPPEQMLATVHRARVLAPDPASVRQARLLVQQACAEAGAGSEISDDAALLTSETVTNALTHGRSEARLQVDATPDVVLVQVGDDNSRHPAPVARDPEALDGRGWEVVQLLAERWGVRDDACGKTVWFEVRAR